MDGASVVVDSWTAFGAEVLDWRPGGGLLGYLELHGSYVRLFKRFGEELRDIVGCEAIRR
jgi:hypothetical protein